MIPTRQLAVVVAVAAVVLAGVPAVPASAQAGGDACSFPVTRTDATGTDVTVTEQPERIVSLNPSAAQTLWEIGAKDQVVGVSQFATYLDGADEREVLDTTPGSVDVERIVALEPDLVFAPGTISEETVDNLRSNGLTVFSFESPASIESVAEKTTRFGRLTGHCEGASETNAWMRQNVENVRSAVADEERPRAMYYFSGGYTVGSETFIHDVMTTAGTENVMAANVSGYAQANPEVVRERDPQWLLLNSRDDDLPTTPAYRETTALRENQTVVVDVNYLNQPAPRSIVYAVRNITEVIHPEAYESAAYVSRSAVESTATTDAEASDAPETAATTEAAATTATTATDETETSESLPGFGAALAAAAILAAGALAGRRR